VVPAILVGFSNHDVTPALGSSRERWAIKRR